MRAKNELNPLPNPLPRSSSSCYTDSSRGRGGFSCKFSTDTTCFGFWILYGKGHTRYARIQFARNQGNIRYRDPGCEQQATYEFHPCRNTTSEVALLPAAGNHSISESSLRATRLRVVQLGHFIPKPHSSPESLIAAGFCLGKS